MDASPRLTPPPTPSRRNGRRANYGPRDSMPVVRPEPAHPPIRPTSPVPEWRISAAPLPPAPARPPLRATSPHAPRSPPRQSGPPRASERRGNDRWNHSPPGNPQRFVHNTAPTTSSSLRRPPLTPPEPPRPAPVVDPQSYFPVDEKLDPTTEFAFEIGSGLLTEVRRLQALLAERDKALQDLKEEKDDLERSGDALRQALKTQEGTRCAISFS